MAVNWLQNKLIANNELLDQCETQMAERRLCQVLLCMYTSCFVHAIYVFIQQRDFCVHFHWLLTVIY